MKLELLIYTLLVGLGKCATLRQVYNKTKRSIPIMNYKIIIMPNVAFES
jgi:hypothetical protein